MRRPLCKLLMLLGMCCLAMSAERASAEPVIWIGGEMFIDPSSSGGTDSFPVFLSNDYGQPPIDLASFNIDVRIPDIPGVRLTGATMDRAGWPYIFINGDVGENVSGVDFFGQDFATTVTDQQVVANDFTFPDLDKHLHDGFTWTLGNITYEVDPGAVAPGDRIPVEIVIEPDGLTSLATADPVFIPFSAQNGEIYVGSTVPEPATIVLFALVGMIAAAGTLYRRYRTLTSLAIAPESRIGHRLGKEG